MDWSLQDAQSNLAALIRRTLTEGAQIVTISGRRAAVVLSAEHYDRLAGTPGSIVDHIVSGEAWDDDLVEDVGHRGRSPGRNVDL